MDKTKEIILEIENAEKISFEQNFRIVLLDIPVR